MHKTKYMKKTTTRTLTALAVSLFSLMIYLPGFAFSKPASKVPVYTYVLVHGAWSAPYAWKMVKAELEKKGQRVVTVQLPGHGSDQTAVAGITMDSYITAVVGKINHIKGRVILVGHSMAGMIISGVAEQIPGKIQKLVYIAAYVPQSGQSAYAISMLDKQSQLGGALLPTADNTLFNVKPDQITNIFCQDGSAAVKKMILAQYRPEPAMPFSNPVNLSAENFGKVSKSYISTLQDHGIGVELQNQMTSAAGIIEVYKLESGHTPFLSMPSAVTAILLKTAQQ